MNLQRQNSSQGEAQRVYFSYISFLTIVYLSRIGFNYWDKHESNILSPEKALEDKNWADLDVHLLPLSELLGHCVGILTAVLTFTNKTRQMNTLSPFYFVHSACVVDTRETYFCEEVFLIPAATMATRVTNLSTGAAARHKPATTPF